MAETEEPLRLHALSLGQLPGQATISASNAATAFSDPGDLLNYCAANPDAEAGYAPSGQMNPQVLPCQQWPSLFPGYAASATCYDSSGNVITCGSVSTTTSLTDWLTQTSIDSIPNWFLLAGILGLAWWWMQKKGMR